MEFIIVGMICFSKIDTDSICMPFEQSPRVEYQKLDQCLEVAEKQKMILRKSFNSEGLLVDELIVSCVNNPYKSKT